MTETLVIGFLVAAALSGLLTACVLHVMRRLPVRQTVRDDGPASHLSKQGTPHMGGVAIALTILAVSPMLGAADRRVAAVVATALGFAAIGFVDVVMKAFRPAGKGWKARYRILLQAAVATAFAGYVHARFGGVVKGVFAGVAWTWPTWLWAPVCVLAVVGAGNAANLTDGLDGLLAGVAAICATALCLTALTHGESGAAALSAVLAGACVGFLFLNARPAKIWMGDTGSLAIGAALGAIAMAYGLLIPFVIAAGVLVAEAASVVVQVYYKRTGRRVFRMAPLHHHLELSGWSEPVVVRRFWIVGAALTVASILVVRA
ncbi:MAG: phospho-N-acetylmuramoyl-pentapeptide-transferase [Armatimonadota bacterium]